MCTCMVMGKKNAYFGRSMDFEYRFGERVAITPRNMLFSLKNGLQIRTRYAMIGMAAVRGEYPLYAEAVNEKGVAMAGLNFPGMRYILHPYRGS